jgi:hypothetical protein
VGQKTRLLHEILTRLVITENTFHVNISWRGQVFWPTKVQEAYNIIFFLLFMENSILKIFGSVDVKITPDFCS